MAYPREIYLDEDTNLRLITYLNDVLMNHRSERQEHIDDLKRWQKEYWAKPTNEVATFPYKGAATIVIPLDAIAVEAVHSRTMTTRFALSDLVSAQSISNEWDVAAPAFERFMNRELMDNIKIKRPFGDCCLEAEKYGTMFGKVSYEKLVKTSIRRIGDRDEEFDVVVADGAQFEYIPDARFIMPLSEQNPQFSAWCGQEHSKSPYNVQQLEAGGLFRAQTIIDLPGAETDPEKEAKLKRWINRTADSSVQTGTTVQQNQETLERSKPQWPKTIDWNEVWLAWDVDKSGRAKEIIVHYHYDSQTIMSIRYNWYHDLRRPYRMATYFPVEGRGRGIGICKMNEQFQKEITVQHRQRIDNATLANMRMLKVSKLSNYGPKEPVFPGKMWFLDDMTHVDTLQLGEIYPSSYSNEQATLIYSQQRTGIGELQLGQGQVGTPGTATSDLARIQEGNKKSDFYYSNVNDFLHEIILDCADVTHQFGPRQRAYFETAAGGDLVKKLFEMPPTFIRDGLLIALKPTTTQHNKIVDRQNWTQIAPLIEQYYNGLLTLAQLGGQPQLQQIIITKGMNAVTEAMRQILETFDVKNINRLIVTEIEDMVRNGLQGITQPAGNNQPTNPGQIPGMDLITQALQGAR